MDILNMLVFDTERNIDVEATVDKFRNAVILADQSRRNDLDVVSKEVHALFDKYPGSFIGIDAIKSLVRACMDVHPNAYGVIGDRIHKYVQSNTADKNRADGLTEDGKEPLFVLKHGKGGGFARKRDLPVTPKA